MDPRHDIDDLFEGEPDDFDIKKELTEIDLLSDSDSTSTSVDPLRRTGSEELSDLQGGNVLFCAWDDYVKLKQSETDNEEIRPPSDLVKHNDIDRNVGMSEDCGLSDLIRSKTIEASDGNTNCETSNGKQSIKNSELATPDAENVSHTDQHRRNPATARAPTVRNWKISACRFRDLLERASTPSEVELEQMDFQLHKILEQIDSVYLRQELHKADPTLSKRKLFRLYRHAMKMMQDSDDEDEHQEIDAQRFSIFAGDPGDYENVGFEDSSSSKDNSRNISKDEARQQSEGNQHKIQENFIPSSSDAVAQRSRSSLLHSKPYLNEISPYDVEGHFPTTITRSPQRSKSRTSSLASETRFERQTKPLESANEQPDVSTHDDSSTPGYARTSAQSQLLPALPFHSGEGRTLSSGRSGPLRPSAASPAASVYAVAGSPAPDPASISRLDFSSHRYMSQDDESMEDVTPYSSDTSPVPTRGIRPSPLKREHRTSDPFVAGADEISFPSPSTYSPPLSPLLDFAGQIYQPIRQSVRKRGATDAGKCKGKRPAGRAVSAKSLSKARVSARNNVESAQNKRAKSVALGVQGDNVKVKKPRAVSRKASSRAARSNKVQHDDAEEIPRVPSLPMDMDVDLPLPELRVSFSADEATPQEAEGGKLHDESQRSPSNRNTKTTAKTTSKAKPQQRTNVRKSNDRDKEVQRSSPIEYDSAPSSLSGASPSPTPRKASTRGLAVRKTRASARRNVAGQQLDEPKLGMSSQISSPKAIPPPAVGKRTPTPAKKSTRAATPASGKTDSTVDISPKTPARKRKAKPAAGGTGGKADIGNAADVNRGKLTPTSEGMRRNDQAVSGTPARRSLRIVSLRATN